MPVIETSSSLFENLPATAMTPPRAKRSGPKNEKGVQLHKKKKTSLPPLSTPKKLANFTIPKKKKMNTEEEKEVLTPIGQIDGQDQEDTEKKSTPKPQTHTIISPSEPTKEETPKDDSDLEEGEVPDSDDEICIVNLVKASSSTTSQKKEIRPKHHRRHHRRHLPLSRRRGAISSSDSESSSSSSSEVFSSSSSHGRRSRSRSRSPITTSMKAKSTHSDISMYAEQSPYPGTKSSAIQFRCLDMIRPTPEPSPMPPPPLVKLPFAKHDTSLSLEESVHDEESGQDKSIPEEEHEKSVAESTSHCDEILDDTLIGDDSIHDESITDEPIRLEDDDDAIDLGIPNEDRFNSSNEDEGEGDPPTKPEVEDKVEDDPMSCDTASIQRVYPDDINNLLQYRLCFNSLEYGSCSNEKKCDSVHILDPVKIFVYYNVIRDNIDAELPPFLRRSAQNRVHRLLSIYHSHKNHLITFNPWCSLSLLNLSLDDLQTSLSPDDYKCYILMAKNLWTDLDSLYPSQTFSNDYLRKITVVEISGMMTALESLCNIAFAYNNQETSLSARLVWSVFNFALERGLVLNPGTLNNIWDVLLADGNTEYLPYVANYVAEKPDIHINLNRLNKTLKLVMEQRQCEQVPLLSDMFTTLMNIEPFHAGNLDRALLQAVVNRCQGSDSSELKEFTDRLKSFMIPNLYLIETPRIFKDVALENRILGLIEKRKWSNLADLVLAIPLSKTSDLYDFSLKLFEIITEEDKEGDLLDDALDKFANEVYKRNGERILPIHSKMLSQLAASIIIHLQHEHLHAMSTVITCFQLQLEPWCCATYFNPDAESEAIATRHQEFEVVKAGMEICMADPNFVFDAYKLMKFNRSCLDHMTHQEMFELSK
jgi:hypothetical protein